MLRFRGNSPATVDEKGRLKLPTSFKAELETFAQGEGGGALRHYLTSLDGRSARLYPMPVWEGIEARLAALPSTSPAKRKFLETTAYFGSEVEPDAQGRFVITLADGEIWQQDTGDNGAPRWRNAPSRYVVNIYEGALGSYNLNVSDDSTLYKVHRIN